MRLSNSGRNKYPSAAHHCEVETMVETPFLFLATRCVSLLDARQKDIADMDSLFFEPGFPALQVLCEVVTGRQVSEQTAWEPIDGPPDPEADEGFQLFRMTDEVVRRIAGIAFQEQCDTAAIWAERLQKAGRNEPSTLTTALAGLTNLARRGESSDKAVFLKVLFR
jgi:hypothetical protein